MLIAIIRTLILYVFVIFAVRIMGKRQISDLQPTELVITLIISDIASLPLENTDQPLLSGVVPVLILIFCEIIASMIMMKNGKFRKLICGSPVMVIEDGEIKQDAMKKLRMTTEDLCIQLRQADVFCLEDVQYCIVETNGKLSVLKKPPKRNPDASDMGIEIPDNGIEVVVISDGEYLDNSIKLCGINKDKLNKILSKNKVKKDGVFIMTCDKTGNYNIIEKEKKG
ncbi:MAG: DUF421 domain-containing protein [bacterium]|nr:DUF421 domain-containing protein [bacterium]MDD6225669.1 DUF421 domain-containing protein [bacterium]MDY3861008.1 DUF421 domain-containing protein [Ruminococcus sp.]